MSTFSTLGLLQTPSHTRLLSSACCPDKDLIVLISRLGGRDRLGLWNYSHGSKVWEVDVGVGDENTATDIVGIAWSPDGQTIVAAHHPPLVTLHSLQDGTNQLTLLLYPSPSPSCNITGVWWFRDGRTTKVSSIPDILRRHNVVTGTAHSILRALPLLDNLQDDPQRLTATDLFAFQGTQPRPSNRPSLPSVIDDWPTLPLNHLAATISAPSVGKSIDPLAGSADEADSTNFNSLLVVADSCGSIYSFLDGTFPLGKITLGPDLSVRSLFKHQERPIFLTNPSAGVQESMTTSLCPVNIDTPLLGQRHVRDLAQLASTARELVWYCMRAIKELHTTWFGSETFSGARELGPNWLQALEKRQKEQFGQEDPNAILDLTTLLVTGKATDSLLDFLGSGNQMSERGIQKWESTMTEALVKLRDYSEKRIAPACQRLHLVLEEVQGWSQLSQYTLFELSLEDVKTCLDHTKRAIILAAWLADTARRDLSRFRAFLHWLRFETTAANPTHENALQPRHDILEVNNYLISGISTSSIDRWFIGPVPLFSLRDLEGIGDDKSILNVTERARALAKGGPVSQNVPQIHKEHFDRNLNELINELATRCMRVFKRASGAASRSASIRGSASSATDLASRVKLEGSLTPCPLRERTADWSETRCSFQPCQSCGTGLHQYLAQPVQTGQTSLLCMVQLCYNGDAFDSLTKVDTVLLEPFLPVSDDEVSVGLDLLEVDFLDDEYVVIVYRVCDDDMSANIATVAYRNCPYQPMVTDEHVKSFTREELVLKVVGQWKEGHISTTRCAIQRTRALTGGKTGGVSLALNGRQGRRVACVLDSKGTLESFDMEKEEEEDEERT